MPQSRATSIFLSATSWHISYEAARERGKLGPLIAGLLLFKSCVSLGIFNYPYAFAKAGYL